jgi:hypothetical protein
MTHAPLGSSREGRDSSHRNAAAADNSNAAANVLSIGGFCNALKAPDVSDDVVNTSWKPMFELL